MKPQEPRPEDEQDQFDERMENVDVKSLKTPQPKTSPSAGQKTDSSPSASYDADSVPALSVQVLMDQGLSETSNRRTGHGGRR